MTAPMLRVKWLLGKDGRPRCSWCLAETGTPPIADESHGICSTHKRKMIAEARADARQGKRADQVDFSAKTLFWCLAGCVVLVAAMWLWRVTR